MPFTTRSKALSQTKSLSSLKSKEVMEEEQEFIEPKFPIRKYDYMEGRNYRKSSKPNEQFVPCDDEEIERLQVNHLLFKNLFVTPFFSPMEEQLKEGIKVLDVASGPGWWMADMGIRYPKSHFTGIDAMMFPISSPPTNCHFRVADISKGLLPFPDNTFDFVTQHDVLFKYSQNDWNTMLPELVRVCKPGGYIELVEPAGQIQDVGPNMSVWMMRLTVSLQSRGIDSKVATQIGNMLEANDSLDHVEASHRSAPIGWYGKNGDLMLECIERLFEATKPKLCEDWSMEPARYDKVTKTASAECRDFRSWFNIHFAFAQKKALGIKNNM